MKCLICGGEAAGEVCNQCIRLEKIVFQKEWAHKAGLIGKAEDLRVSVSNLRISGRLPMADNARGLNSRIDNVSHYLLNVKDVEEASFGGKKAMMVHIENAATNFNRYLFLPGLDDVAGFNAAVADARTKAVSLTDRIRQQKGLAPVGGDAAPAPAVTTAPPVAPRPMAQPVAAKPIPTPEAPVDNYDTVALSGMADDLSEFETKIKKLKVLRDNGILSEEEYIAEKKKLVSIF